MQAAHMNPIFQFHLVRLKVSVGLVKSASILISIPFSTIKSEQRGAFDSPITHFNSI